MMEQPGIKWGSDLGKAKEEAGRTNKLILMFFHSRSCSGCKATIAKVLPDREVSKFITDNFVPLMYEVSEQASKDLMKRYEVQWTPTFVAADQKGDTVYRWEGYLPTDDFQAQMLMAEAKMAFKAENFSRAEKCYSAVAGKYPKSDTAPEAVYYLGVSRYKRTEDPSHLKNANEELKSKYPENVWTKKASVWG
ncbi:MAG TPA: thioredoxin fold domain-containing protein [Methanocellaceae archaeon]